MGFACLPSMARLLILLPALAAGQEKPVLVAFGDSTTAPRGTLRVYAALLQDEFPDLRVVNAGVGGDTTARARARLEKDVLAHKPALVVVQFGINDATVDLWKDPPAREPRVPKADYEAGLREIVQAVRSRGASAVLVTPNPLRWSKATRALYGKPPYRVQEPDGFSLILRDYAELVRKVAREEKISFVDVYAAFDEYDRPKGQSMDELLLDGMHPNEKGHRLVADRLIPKVKEALRQDLGGLRRPAEPPLLVGPVRVGANLVVLPGGAWETFSARRVGDAFRLARSRSTDEGRAWSEPEDLRELPGASWGGAVALLDRRGEVQLFFLNLRPEGTGRRIAVDRFIDIWHLRSSDGRTKWGDPKRIFEGYVGSAQGALQLKSGRIVLPFASWVAGRASGPPTGSNFTTALTSDNDGATWTLSPAKLVAPCREGYNGSNYGAIEPVVAELADGRAWMLLRTQTGRLYESFSKDGAEWTEARPSALPSSNSPAAFARASDGRLAVFWNNCGMPPRVDRQGVYGGRDALHAAISDDEGRTWRGYREVYLDPARDQTPPKTGDRGTAYPFAFTAGKGKIGVVSGQGAGRRGLVLVDPDWLLETRRADDFSKGLDGWCVFKEFGPASRFWRDRVAGAELVPHPDRKDARALQVRRPDERAGDGAVWNFPMGRRGRLTLRLLAREGFAGGSVALADRFFNPTDDAAHPLFQLALGPGGLAPEPGRWHAVVLEWDVARGQCGVRVDDREAAPLAMSGEMPRGACYLRLRSTAERTDPGGFLVESVVAEIIEP